MTRCCIWIRTNAYRCLSVGKASVSVENALQLLLVIFGVGTEGRFHIPQERAVSRSVGSVKSSNSQPVSPVVGSILADATASQTLYPLARYLSPIAYSNARLR